MAPPTSPLPPPTPSADRREPPLAARCPRFRRRPVRSAAAIQNVLESGRCNCDDLQPGSPAHTSQAAIRLAFVRAWRAFTRAVATSITTASSLPKFISSGVEPLKARKERGLVAGAQPTTTGRAASGALGARERRSGGRAPCYEQQSRCGVATGCQALRTLGRAISERRTEIFSKTGTRGASLPRGW
jgi:hypothetical protein